MKEFKNLSVEEKEKIKKIIKDNQEDFIEELREYVANFKKGGGAKANDNHMHNSILYILSLFYRKKPRLKEGATPQPLNKPLLKECRSQALKNCERGRKKEVFKNVKRKN